MSTPKPTPKPDAPTPQPGEKLTKEQQKDWEKKLKQYAYVVTITCDALVGIDKIATDKLSGNAKAVVDSGVRAVYTGLSKLYSMFQSGFKQVQDGKMPDYTNAVPFPHPPPGLPTDTGKFTSWFQIAWNTIKDALNMVAMRNSKIAQVLPPIEAAGDSLVENLQKYFPTEKAYVQNALEFPKLQNLKVDFGVHYSTG